MAAQGATRTVEPFDLIVLMTTVCGERDVTQPT